MAYEIGNKEHFFFSHWPTALEGFIFPIEIK